MKLSKIIQGDYKEDIEITDLTDDSRVKMESGIFFAGKGLTVDGHDYIDSAIANGAKVVVCEKDVESEAITIKVEDSFRAYNDALNNFYDRPLDNLKLIAVTGTDGKTTTTEIIYQLFNRLDTCGYMGTNGVRCPSYEGDNSLTTPLPKELFKYLKEFKNHGCKYVSMETSSERLYTKKLEGIDFEVSIFTNLTPDHLETHKTMENYAASKALLFKNTKGLSIINHDDEKRDYFIEASSAPVKTYGFDKNATIYATNVLIEENHLEFDINGCLGEHHIVSKLSGEFNVYNLMSVMLVMDYFGYKIEDVIEGISKLEQVAARQMSVEEGQDFRVWIDYAHTPAAVKRLIDYVKEITKGKLIVVTGAAGSRDPYRSRETAKVCVKNADYNIFTIEDSRGEDPVEVINRSIEGITETNFETEIDREIAIKKGLEIAEKDDTVLILGKGLESFEKVNGELVYKKNDYELARDYLKEIKNA